MADTAITETCPYAALTADYSNPDEKHRPAGSVEELDELVSIIVECICSSAETIRVANQDIPQETVKNRLLKLDSEHICYVLDSLAANTSRIRNIKAYLITALYNAPSTFSSYVSASIRHSMPEFAKQHP
ncbi:MAG: hypothetical protein IJX77_01775 [Ruminococcus sp.]|nr:hypothetical protein [Ruminococcus sp.]